MRKTFLTISSGLLLWGQSVVAQSISAGYGVTSTVCGNGKVYAWGNNSTGGTSPVLGILGTGSTSAIVPTAAVVQFPISGGGTFKQVNSKGGSHFLAFDCDGHVWSWGNNSNGQLGNGGLNPAASTVPAPVKPGQGPSAAVATTSATIQGLSEVASVQASAFNSFAMLKSGRLLAWGANSATLVSGDNLSVAGMLGNGTTVDQHTPVFVIDGKTNQPLEKVLQVQAGDAVAYALVDDGSGVGTGVVYSWGNGMNGTLGRNANGIGNPGAGANQDQQSSVALPVIKADGKPLSNIVSISAGAVFCLALDADGYVWAWGLGAWGGCTGQGTQITHSDPRRVVRGTTYFGGTDGTYLLAKSIAAGQGFASAVTIDGTPVAWGNNGGASNGGYLGNSSSSLTPSLIPSPIVYSPTGASHNDVISVSQGVLNGYYQRADGSVWTWGENSYGELGLGNTVDQLLAVAFTMPTCTGWDPAPYARFSTSDTSLCESRLAANPVVLNANFPISNTLPDLYTIAWYKNNVLIPSSLGTIKAKGITLSVSAVGTYKVKVAYTGTNSPCGGYVADSAEISIKGYPKTFDAPTDLTYCKNIALVHVNQNANANDFAKYRWYATSISPTAIGLTIGGDLDTLDVTTVPVINSSKTVYVQEYMSAGGTVMPSPPAASNDDIAAIVASNQGNDMFIKVLQDITLDTLTLSVKSFAPNIQSFNFQFKAYGIKTTCAGPAADRSQVIASGPVISIPVSSTFSTIKVPVGIMLSGSTNGNSYFVGLTSNLEGYIKTYRGVTQFAYTNSNVTTNTPIMDNFGGKALQVFGTDQNDCSPNAGTYGSFYDWKFSVHQKYCDRVPAILNSCILTSTEEESVKSSLPTVSPNPFKEQLQLKAEGCEKVMVFHADGSLLEERNLSGENSISLGQNWKRGLYLIQLVGKGSSATHKVIKE